MKGNWSGNVVLLRFIKLWAMTALVLILQGFCTTGLTTAELQPSVVIENPVDYTPQLVATSTVLQPHVDAITTVGGTTYIGGLFEQIVRPGGTPIQVQNIVAFSSTTGVLKAASGIGYADPQINGQIWAMVTDGANIYIGGEFTAVNGISRTNLVKVNAHTGAVDMAFNAGYKGGIIWDLKLWSGPTGSTPMLVVAGNMGKRLFALNPVTGADTSYFNLGIADPIPNAWGTVAIYKIAINPTGNRLIATGNFQTVLGAPRKRFFMADISGPQATLASWYYPGFAKDCASTAPRRIAYLQGVDFSPDGRYFVVTATGQIPKDKADIWPAGTAQYHTVCDAAARFNMSDDKHPVWINYTGGDSIWSTSVTGVAVYVQGHFVWLDNPNGFASMDGGGASQRYGIGAIDPVTGKALVWDPPKPANIGGKVLLATSAGLWVGSDSQKFNREAHRGIAFVPLP